MLVWIIAFILLRLLRNSVHCNVDIQATRHEIEGLIRLEQSLCGEGRYFYGKDNRNVLVNHPIALFKLYQHWTNLTGCQEELRAWLPSLQDLKGMALNIQRIQDIYDLAIEDLIEGKVAGKLSPWTLDAEDCRFISMTALEDLEVDRFKLWSQACIKLDPSLKDDFEQKLQRLQV